MRLPRTFEAHIMPPHSSCYTILLALGLGLAVHFRHVFWVFFLFPFGMRLLFAIYWKCLTCFSQELTVKSLTSVPWEIWKSY